MQIRRRWYGAALRVTMFQAFGLRISQHSSSCKDRAWAANYIDAKSDRAANWYAAYGAVPLVNTPLTLVMSLVTFATELKATGRR